jgi:predicted Rdx family selenoprotein
LAEKVLDEKVDKVSQVTLIPSGGGVHEVKLGDEVLHSKQETGEHPSEDAVLAAI